MRESLQLEASQLRESLNIVTSKLQNISKQPQVKQVALLQQQNSAMQRLLKMQEDTMSAGMLSVERRVKLSADEVDADRYTRVLRTWREKVYALLVQAETQKLVASKEVNRIYEAERSMESKIAATADRMKEMSAKMEIVAGESELARSKAEHDRERLIHSTEREMIATRALKENENQISTAMDHAVQIESMMTSGKVN